MSMQDDTQGAIDTGESWTPPDQQAAAVDESQGLDTSAPQSQPSYMNPPPGNPIQSGAQATEKFLGNTFGQQGPIPNTGGSETDPEVPNPNAPGQQPSAPAAPGSQGPITQKIMQMLQGAGAMNPAQLDVAIQSVPGDTVADKNVNLIHKAYQEGGPEAAEKVLQANRVAYDTKSAFARTALMGTPQKPADLNAAIKAANQAQENLPDGSNVLFSPGGNGTVIAVAQFPGSKHTAQFNLTTQQFSQFLDVGKDGQFDKMFDTSAPAMLQKLANAQGGGSNAPGQAQAPAQADSNFAPSQESMDKVKQQDADKASGVTPGMSDDGANTARESAAQEAKWKQQAMDQFPWASQQKQRGEYISAQRNQSENNQNKVDVAGETGKARIKVAEATGRSRENAATTIAGAKVEAAHVYSEGKKSIAVAALDRAMVAEQGKNNRASAANEIGLIKKKIETGQPLNDQENALATKYGAAADKVVGAPQAPTPQAPNPNQAQSDNAGKKFYNGQWYTREEYQKAFGK